MSQLGFKFTVIDGISEPASNMKSSLEAVNGSLASVGKSISQTEGLMGKINGVSAAYRQVDTALKGMASSLVKAHKAHFEAGKSFNSSAKDSPKILRMMDNFMVDSLSGGKWYGAVTKLQDGIGASLIHLAKYNKTAVRAFVGIGNATKAADKYLAPFGLTTEGLARKILPAIGPAASKVGSALATMGSVAVAGAAAAVAAYVAVVVAVTAVGIAVANAAYEFSKFVVNVGSSREKFSTVFEGATGSAANAGWMLRDAGKMAYQTGQSVDAVRNQYAALTNAGLDWYKTQRMIKVMAAANAGTGSDAAGNAILNTINQLNFSGKLEAKNLKALSAAGISEDDMFAALAKQRGSSIDEIKRLNTQGKITANDWIETMAAVGEQKHGSALEKHMGGMEAIMARFTDMPTRMMNEAFDASDTSGISGFFNKIKGAMGGALSTIFNDDGGLTSTGTRVVGILNKMGDTLSTVFDKLTGGVDAGSTFEKVLTIIETLWPYLDAFTSGVFEGIADVIKPFLDQLNKIPADGGAQPISQLVTAMKYLGQGIVYVCYGTIWLLGKFGDLMMTGKAVGLAIKSFATDIISFHQTAFSGVYATVSGFLTNIYEKVSGFGQSMWEAGGNLAKGLASGITAFINNAVDAAIEMAHKVKGAVEAYLKIKSPSLVFEQLGAYTSAGFAEGIQGGAPQAQQSVLSMVAPPTVAQLPQVASQMSAHAVGSAGSGSFQIRIENITISGAATKDDVKRGMLEAWEEIALEMGLIPQVA